MQAQATELAAHRQLGQALGPCQAGVVVGGAAGVLGQQVQWGHIVGRLQARCADAAPGFKHRLGGLGGRLPGHRVGGVHAAVDQGGPAQQRGLELAHLKTALVELQRAVQLVEPGCAGQHAQVVAIELHTALHAGVVQVQQGQLQGKAGEHRAAGLGGLQRPREQLVQRGLPHHAQYQGGIGQALGLHTQHRLVGHVGNVHRGGFQLDGLCTNAHPGTGFAQLHAQSVKSQSALQSTQPRPGDFTRVHQRGGHHVQFAVFQRPCEQEGAVFGPRKGQFVQIALDLDLHIFIAALHQRIAQVVPHFGRQVQGQVAVHGRRLRPLNAPFQAQDAGALALGGGLPLPLPLALQVGIGQAQGPVRHMPAVVGVVASLACPAQARLHLLQGHFGGLQQTRQPQGAARPGLHIQTAPIGGHGQGQLSAAQAGHVGAGERAPGGHHRGTGLPAQALDLGLCFLNLGAVPVALPAQVQRGDPAPHFTRLQSAAQSGRHGFVDGHAQGQSLQGLQIQLRCLQVALGWARALGVCVVER